jgi:hypothetical protein
MPKVKIEGSGQSPKLKRQVVHLIKEYYRPQDIYNLIMNGTPWDYRVSNKEKYVIRNRAGIVLTYLSGGRVSAVFGGWKYKWNPLRGKEQGHKSIGKRFDKETGK